MAQISRQVLKYVCLDITAYLVVSWVAWMILQRDYELQAGSIWMSLGIAGIPIAAIVYQQYLSLYEDYKGFARWMRHSEAKNLNLFQSKGIILGRKWGRYLTSPGWEHVLCFAPSGSGKTTSIVIPNLLSWDQSCVILDLKQELFDKTSGFRQACGSECYLFNPGAHDSKTHRYNPLTFLPRSEKLRISQVQKLGVLFFPDKGGDMIWVSGPRNLFAAVVLYLLSVDKSASLGKVLRLLKSHEFDEFSEKILEDGASNELIISNISEYISFPEKTRASIRASTIAGLHMFESPLVDEATSASDFDINQLRKRNMTIYLGVSNDNLEMLAPLINSFFQQVLNVLTEHEPTVDEPFGVLMIMDEFAALGRMNPFKVNIGLLRSYKVRLMIIIQDLAQLYDIYGQQGAQSFLNVKTRIAFAQNSLETADYISKLAGIKRDKTHKKRSSFELKPLMASQQLLRMCGNKAVVLIEGNHPILIEKCFWYKQRVFKKRILSPIEFKKEAACIR